MTPEELVVRLTLYRREIFRRGLVLVLCSLLPGCTLLTVGGLWLVRAADAPWKVILFCAALFVFIMLNFLAFLYMVCRSLPKKLDLHCPHCRALLMDTPPEQLTSAGTCARCGGSILTLPAKQDPIKVEATPV